MRTYGPRQQPRPDEAPPVATRQRHGGDQTTDTKINPWLLAQCCMKCPSSRSAAQAQRRTMALMSRRGPLLEKKPDSRRHIVSAWNPADVDRMALPPCHLLFQFYVAGGRLSCQMYQRSADLFLGVPFNIASYALLTLMVAQVTRLKPGEFILTLGDAHLYRNHLDQAREQLARTPRPFPRLRLNPAVRELLDFKYEDFTLEAYDPHPAIRAPIAV